MDSIKVRAYLYVLAVAAVPVFGLVKAVTSYQKVNENPSIEVREVLPKSGLENKAYLPRDNQELEPNKR